MLRLFKDKVTHFFSGIGSHLSALFTGNSPDDETFSRIERLLIQADIGLPTTKFIISELKKRADRLTPTTIHIELSTILQNILKIYDPSSCAIYLLVGINGSGKTTLAAKLAKCVLAQTKKPLLVAADTFRAAATEQLNTWAHTLSIDIVSDHKTKDPGSIVFDGCAAFNKGGYEALIIDTAGRLQTKQHLMQELAKLKRILNKSLPDKNICTLLTIDATLGLNSIAQAKIFHEATDVSAIALTKFDSLAKGGTLFAISNELKLPIAWISYGESLDSLKQFDSKDFCEQFVNIDR